MMHDDPAMRPALDLVFHLRQTLDAHARQGLRDRGRGLLTFQITATGRMDGAPVYVTAAELGQHGLPVSWRARIMDYDIDREILVGVRVGEAGPVALVALRRIGAGAA